MKTGGVELRLGDWRKTLARVREVDALITDPPYSARTHAKQQHGRRNGEKRGYREKTAGNAITSRGLGYACMTDADVYSFVAHWSPRTRGWFCAFTDSELYPVWRDALRNMGRYVFAPLPCVQRGMNVRLAGDGPSSWTTWLVVARPRGMRPLSGTLPGAYIGTQHTPGFDVARGPRVPGQKPLWLMRAILGDYTSPGDLICDPCAGGGTTLLAAKLEDRRAIGAEALAPHYEIACERLKRAYPANDVPTVPATKRVRAKVSA